MDRNIYDFMKQGRSGPGRWTWIFLAFSIGLGLVSWLIVERPRFQKSATQVAIAAQDDKKQAPAKYGFSFYQQHSQTEFAADNPKPFFYLVIDGVGLHQQLTDEVFKDFPPPVTFSFSPYTPQAQTLMNSAWKGGHEVWLQLPLESLDGQDKGPFMLMSDVPAAQNIKKLREIWNAGESFVGVIAGESSAVLSSQGDLMPLIEELHNQDLAIVDASLSNESLVDTVAATTKIPRGQAHARLLSTMPNGALMEVLDQAERQAQEKGFVVVVASLHPLVLQTLKSWWRANSHKFILAPLSQSLKVVS